MPNQSGRREPSPLQGKNGLILGIAKEHSVAYGCAKAFREAGAQLAITCLNGKAELQSPIVAPCDMRELGLLEAVFVRIRNVWGRLDFALHSIAFAPKEDLPSRVIDCSQAGFALAMDVF